MKTVILCGGMGTRIRDANEQIPKPLLPIGGRPIVWHIMKGYAAHGFKDFVLCLGYKSWLFKEFFLNYRAMGSDLIFDLGSPGAVEYVGGTVEDWRVTLAETGEASMTGGRVGAVRHYLEGASEFLLTYGDGVSDVNVAKLLAFHRAHGHIATVTAVRPPARFGELEIGERGRVLEFNEKPQASQGFINGGFFVLDARRFWDYLPGEKSTVLEAAPLQRLARDGELVAFEHTGFWQPMDTFREYQLLNEMWSTGCAPWKTWRD
ncbi:MAG: glucose-1-phosphate cytidylyltransferase [Polyangiaceae bacterium]|nr:glucose-1-phosphate cytidylyltransferase [Polyangiaceae bacterium]